MSPWQCTSRWLRRSTGRSARSGASSAPRARAARRSARAGRCSCCVPPRAGRGRRRSTASPSRAAGAPIRCPSLMGADTDRHLAELEEWLRSYQPEELFNADGTPDPELRRLPADGQAPHGREPPRQRRTAAARPAHARFSRLCRGGPSPRRGRGAGYVWCWAPMCAT